MDQEDELTEAGEEKDGLKPTATGQNVTDLAVIEQSGTAQITTKENPHGITLSSRKLTIMALGYLPALGAAEYVSHYISSTGGIIFYLAILFSLIINAALAADQSQRGLWLALGLAPLIRTVSLAMPVMLQISPYLWYIAISIPIIAGVITIMRALKYSPDDVGLNLNMPLIQVVAAIAGIGLGIVDYFILKPAAWTSALTIQTTLFPALVLLIFTGIVEELAFRGMMQRAADGLGSYGWVYIAAVYAVLQIGQGSALHCTLALGAGLFFGWTVKNTGSIMGAGLAHGLINIGLYLVLPHIL